MGRIFKIIILGVIILLSSLSQVFADMSWNETQVCNSTSDVLITKSFADGNTTQTFIPCAYGCENTTNTCIALQDKLDYGNTVIFAIIAYFAVAIFFSKVLTSKEGGVLVFAFGALFIIIGIWMMFMLWSLPNNANLTIHGDLAEALPFFGYILMVYLGLVTFGYMYDVWQRIVFGKSGKLKSAEGGFFDEKE